MASVRSVFNICFLLLISCRLQAQDSSLIGKKLLWNLQQCINYALLNNIQINTYRLSRKIAEQEYLLAKAGRQPNLSALATEVVTRGRGFSVNNATVPSIIDSTGNTISNIITRADGRFQTSGQYRISSSLIIYNGNYINYNIKQKQVQLQSANFDIATQENDIALQVTQNYLTVLLDKEIIVYNKDLLVASQGQVEQAQKRYDTGTIPRRDLVQLQAQLATDRFNLISSQNIERQDLLTLKQLLLLPTNALFDIVQPDTITTVSYNIAELHETEQIAMQNRPEIKSSQLNVRASELEWQKANTGYKPSLSAGASLTTSYASTSNTGYFSNLNNNFLQQLDLTLTIPIFTRRVVKTQVEEARINIDQANLNLRNTKITLSQNVERAYISAINAQSQYNAALQGYNANKESYRIANAQLKAGTTTTYDFLQQKNLFIQAQQNYIQAKYSALLNLKIYDFYRGVPIAL